MSLFSGNASSEKWRKLGWGGCALMAAGVLACAEAASAQCTYDVTVVTGPPCFPDPNLSVGFEGINDLGQACGWQAICGQLGNLRPIVWTEELGIVVLPLPEGAERGIANDINNVIGSDGFGQVACTLAGGTLGGDKPYLYNDGSWIPIGLLPGANVGRARDITDSSIIVGECHNTATGPFQAFVWSDGVMSPLELPMGPHDSAWGINEDLQIAGWMAPTGGTTTRRAFILQGAQVIDLGTVPLGTTGECRAINDNGFVTGEGLVPQRGAPCPRYR